MRPIPKSRLPHSATLHNVTTDAYQAETDSAAVASLTNVRFEPTSKVVKTKDNTDLQLAAVMFYDMRSSSPRNQAFSIGQAVKFGTSRFKIELIDQLYDARHLHHLEIGLSGGV